VTITETPEMNEASRREAQLVAATIHGGITVSRKVCWQCKETFVTNNPLYNLCSDWCLSDYLYDRGINWDPEAEVADRWHGDPPDAIISSDTLLVLKVWARKIMKL